MNHKNSSKIEKGARMLITKKIILKTLTLGIFLSFTTFVWAEKKVSKTAHDLKGEIPVDGSSTIFPISESVGEEFQKAHRGTRVAVALSGTGGGFKKLCKGEVDVTGASRPIKGPDPKKKNDPSKLSEIELCQKSNIQYVELPVAYDGIAIVVNPKNTWAQSITVAELKKIWEPGSQVKSWKDLNSSYPDKAIKLFGPGHDSGTFDYFTHAINGAERASRKDFTASEDDNVIVNGVVGEEGALGYFGLAYYEENKARLKVLPVDGGNGPIIPSQTTVANGTYIPLSRPLFIYASETALRTKPQVLAFTQFYIESADQLAPQAGYVSLGKNTYSMVQKRFEKRVVGSMYGDKTSQLMPLPELLSRKTP